MAAENIVFFPKYTTLVEGVYYSDPYDVTMYKSINVETAHTASIASATTSAQIQGSSDLITWTNIGTAMAPLAGNVDDETVTDAPRYLRVEMTIGATGGVATIWVKGVARDS